MAAPKPLGDGGWIPRLHEYGRPYPRVGYDSCSPVLTDVCEWNELSGVSFGTMIDSKICYLYQKFGWKSVRWSVRVQKVFYVKRRGPQHIAQLLKLGDLLEDGMKGQTQAHDGHVLQIITLAVDGSMSNSMNAQ
jgi:hypothetical protein